jgi:Uma2 family endonuclease
MATTALMTGAAFDQLPYEEGRKWELLEGELIPVPSARPRHQLTVSTMNMSIGAYLLRESRGVVLPDSEFALGDAVRLRPDLAILLSDTWTKVDIDKTPIPLAPDIAIEILSPSESAEDNLRKIRTYLRAGTKEAWQVSTKTQTVVLYRADKSGSVLETGDRLNTPLLPGWELLVADLFER